MPTVSEDLSQCPGSCCHQRIGPDTADMAGVAKGHCGDPLLSSLFNSQFRGEAGSYLSQRPMSVHYSGTRGIANDLWVCARLVATLANRPYIFGISDHAVRIVSEEIGLNQMVHDGTRVGGSTARRYEKFVADVTQHFGAESRH